MVVGKEDKTIRAISVRTVKIVKELPKVEVYG